MLSTPSLLTPSVQPGPARVPGGGNATADASPPFARALDQASARQREAEDRPAPETSNDAAEGEDANEASAQATPGAPAVGPSGRPSTVRKALAREALTLPSARTARTGGTETADARETPARQRVSGDKDLQDPTDRAVLDLAGLVPGLPLPRSTVDQAGEAVVPQAKAGKASSAAPAHGRVVADDAATAARPAPGALDLLPRAEAGAVAGERTRSTHQTDARQEPSGAVQGPAHAIGAAAATALDARAAADALAQGLAPTRQGAITERGGESPSPAAAALANAAAFVPAAARAVAGVFQAELSAALGSPEFAPTLGSQLSVLVRDGIEHAQLRLNPAEMGPIEVRISLDGERAQVDFSAAQAATRQILQDAVPVLASALRESGLTLTGGGVFDQAHDPRGESRADTPRAGSSTPGSQADTPVSGLPMPNLPRARGVLDLYA